MPGPDDFPPAAPLSQVQIARGKVHDGLERLKYVSCQFSAGHITLADLAAAARAYHQATSLHCDAVIISISERKRKRDSTTKQGR